jgi:hypothetical protein
MHIIRHLYIPQGYMSVLDLHDMAEAEVEQSTLQLV